MGTIAVFFAVVNFAKIPFYIQLGLFDTRNLVAALVLLPLAPIGLRLGLWMLQRTNQQLIYQLCYVFLSFTGCKLLYDGITNLLAWVQRPRISRRSMNRVGCTAATTSAGRGNGSSFSQAAISSPLSGQLIMPREP